MSMTRVLGISALSVFLFAAAAHAQTPPSPQLQQLHDALNLRPDQDAAWRDYVRSTAVNPQEMAQRRGIHHARRTGGILRQEGESSMEGPQDSAKAAKAQKAWKARRG